MILPEYRHGTPLWSHTLSDNWTVEWDTCEKPLSARVPGYAQHDIFDAGLLPEPFYGTNENQWQDVCDKDFTYRCSFDINDSLDEYTHVELVCDGIDTCSSIELNGTHLRDTDNMYRTWRCDIRDLLQPGKNELVIKIKGARPAAMEKRRQYQESSPILSHVEPEEARNFLRKMPCSFGWDWGIKLPLAGIWKPVRIEAWSDARIVAAPTWTKEITDTSAILDGWVMLQRERNEDVHYNIDIALLAPDGSTAISKNYTAQHDSVPFSLTVPQPQLWWPLGMGEHPLYTLRIELSLGEKLLSYTEQRIGIRTVEWDTSPDDNGAAFYVRVNGLPVFAKGANWIPADAIPSRIQKDDYTRLLSDAAEAGMNMIRVWGGGMYEHDIFYETCDSLGLLVWQDFMFACIVYPVYSEFLRTVAAEARDAIVRLQNHPCLALWCGNNEVEEVVSLWQSLPENERQDYDMLFEYVLHGITHSFDPSRTYWPSSSHARFSTDVKREDSGDTHVWDVWHKQKPFSVYQSHKDRFCSEFGFQSFPHIHTIRTYVPDDQMQVDSPIMMFHQRSGEWANTYIAKVIREHFGAPKGFEEELLLSQLAQADAIESGVRHWRSRRDNNRCMGTLYWQINDNWPVASWSSIDYFGRWKALHYAAKRFYAPVILSTQYTENTLACTLVNDLTTPLDGTLTVRIMSYTGDIITEEKTHHSVAELTAKQLISLTVSDICKASPLHHCMCLFDWTSPTLNTRHIVPLTPLSKAELPPPEITVNQKDSCIQLSSKNFAAHTVLDTQDTKTQFTDNFFHLLPGEHRILQTKPVGNTPGDNAKALSTLKIRTLADLIQ